MDYHHHTHHPDDDDYDYLLRKIIIPIKFPDSVAKIAGGRSVYMREGSLLNISCTIQGQVNIFPKECHLNVKTSSQCKKNNLDVKRNYIHVKTLSQRKTSSQSKKCTIQAR